MNLTGHVLDTHDSRDFVAAPAPALIGSTSDIDLRKFFPAIRNQIANDCCAHASMAAAYATANALGHPIPIPSVLFPYANARLLGGTLGEPLADTGCSLRQLFKSLSGQTVIDSRGLSSGLGLIPETEWPELAWAINTVPPDDCYRDGESAVIGEYYRIEDGVSSIDGIIAALRRQQFPTIAMMVDEAFENVGGGVYVTAGGAVLGSHAMVVAGYSEAAHSFLVRNSWGTGFGDGGYAWIDQGFVAHSTFDKWVVSTGVGR